jgi:hypothetical protein
MATGSKAVRFEIGQITAGNTRVLTVPDRDGTIVLSTDLMIGGGPIDGGVSNSFYGGAVLNFGGAT